MLKLIPRTEFSTLVKETRAERHARGFSSWDHLVAMLFRQLGRANSLREISHGLASCEGMLRFLKLKSCFGWSLSNLVALLRALV